MTYEGEQPLRVLIIDDDEDDYVVIRDLLSEIRGGRFKLEWVPNPADAEEGLLAGRHDVCLMDYRLGARTGLEVMKELIAKGLRTPLIILTGFGEREVDLETMRLGAADYLVKSEVTAPLLERSIRYALHRARNLEVVREREESIRSLLDSTFEGILVHDAQGTVLAANRALSKIFGYEASDLLGGSLSIYFNEADCARLLGAQSEIRFETIGKRRDDRSIQLEVSARPLKYQGKPARLTAVRDIESRKQMEAQILMQDRLASVGLLASGLAHEVGTPLGVIRGRAEYLAIQVKDNEAIKKNVDVIISQIDRVSKLIRSLLNLARGERSAFSNEISFTEVASEVVELMGHELRKHSIEMHNELPEGIKIGITGKAEPLHQVLLNLLVNSVHAIESAQKRGRASGHFIAIRAKDQGDAWEIALEDSGCGISKANLKNLFKPFFTTKEIGVGTGLGLATSFRILESWGGSISAESEEGKGSIFTLMLPKAV